MKIKEMLSKIGREDFYLMHLSHNYPPSRKPLWGYARKNKLIGLSYEGADDDWFKIRDEVRLNKTWRGQFIEFCDRMEKGSCVVVMAGVDKILGVGCVDKYKFEPAQWEEKKLYKYKGEWQGFFDHVRHVVWLKSYPFNEAVSVENLPAFGKTIMHLSPEKPNWKRWKRLPYVSLGPVKKSSLSRALALQVAPKIRIHKRKIRKEEITKKYGPRGEGEAHKKLKEWVAHNPQHLGLKNVINAQIEQRFESGDCVDVVFSLKHDRYAVVEIETYNPMPGAYQALKYKTLLCAEKRLDIKSPRVEAFLVARSLNPNVKRFCREYGIRYVKIKRLY